MHIKQVLKYLSFITIFFSIFMLIPALIGIIYHEENSSYPFVITSAIMATLALLGLLYFGGEQKTNFSQKDAFLFTSLTWICISLFGAIPLLLTGTYTEYSRAFFEVMSGITTTGSTMIRDVEHCYKSVLFFRAMTNWIGGMGIVVLFVAILPVLSTTGSSFSIIRTETVGPVKGKFTPKTKTTAIVLWLLYIALTILQTALLLLGGLPLFDSITIAFSTVSTAGFSIKNASIGSYNSAYIDGVVTAFMLMSAINFSVYYNIFKLKLMTMKKDHEARTLLLIWVIFSIIGSYVLSSKGIFSSFKQAFRFMGFSVASVMSTTGFANTDFMVWPSLCIILVILTMFIGGCSGSTGGGIKVIRLLIMFKSSVLNLRKRIHPNAVYTLKLGDTQIDDNTSDGVFVFFFMYIVSWLLGSLVISISGASLQDCLSSSLLSIGNIGQGFGSRPFYDYPAWTSWFFSFLMLSGRLELFTVYVLFSKAFWKK